MIPLRIKKKMRNRRRIKNYTIKTYPYHNYLHSREIDPGKVVNKKSIFEISGLDFQKKLAEESHYKNLFEKAVTQWRFGNWNALTKLSLDYIKTQSERSTIALLVAAGHLQNNDLQEARQFVWSAKKWGCSKTQISRILIASVHNSLGRAAAVAGQQPRAYRHFKSAILVGTPDCEIKLIAQTRMTEQLKQINNSVRNLADMQREREHRGVALTREKAFNFINKLTLGQDGEVRNRIVIAGMRHSGSTALFNIIRLSLCNAGLDNISFYSEQKDTISNEDISRKILIIKTHEFRDDIAFPNSLIITTRRDLRDTVASAVRRGFPLLRKIGNPVEYAKYNRTLHDVWLPRSHYVFVYEDFINNPIATINKLLVFIGLEDINAKKIYEEVMGLPLDQYNVTLLTPSHITDPEQKLTFNDTLDDETIAKINSEHNLWLDKYNYKTETSK